MPILDIVWVVVLLVLIVLACTVFTNSVEWLGHRYQLSEGAVGSVLAAVGTALPETIVPIVAIVSGALGASEVSAEQGSEIGVGAILGAPFLLSTLAMFIVFASVYIFTTLKKRTLEMRLDKGLFLRDLQYFFVAYLVVFAAAFIPVYPIKVALAIGLLVYYGVYVKRTFAQEHEPSTEFHLEPLYFAPKAKDPLTWLIYLQLLAGIGGIILLAHLFVEEIHHLSDLLGIQALVLSLIVVPIATELPEKFNSVTWLSKRKDNLALGNITGAMVFQSCIPPAVGLSFTPWALDFTAMLSVILCLASSGVLYLAIRLQETVRPLVFAIGGIFYLIFVWHAFSQM